jgi:YesN/AraC family two-component response regulator
MAVQSILNDLSVRYEEVGLGYVDFPKQLAELEFISFKAKLEKLGFELLNDRRMKLVEQIKNEIIRLVHHQENADQIVNLTQYLPNVIGCSYSSLSKLFSEIEGLTIEKYLILQKVEKAKELLFYEELTISEIAYQLNYSSSQHFSRQFKSVTGLTPTGYVKNRKIGRNPISEV